MLVERVAAGGGAVFPRESAVMAVRGGYLVHPGSSAVMRPTGG